MSRLVRGAALLAATAALAGCTTFSADGGFGPVATAARDRLGAGAADAVRWQRSADDSQSARKLVSELLAQPLTADDAVRIALVNNPGLQATYAELGIAEADVVAAGRMRNPHLSVLRTSRGGVFEKGEDVLSLELMSLITIPLRSRMEARRFERVQHDVAAAMLRVAGDARRAWVRAVASAELARYMGQALDASEASAELARRVQRAGNAPQLMRMRHELFQAEVQTAVERARHAALADRERLVRLLGIERPEANFALAARLPDLPANVVDDPELETKALADRLDVQAAKRDAESLAASLGLTRATRFINVLELGRARTREGDHPWAYGYEASVELPLFDWGGSKVAKAEALYMQSVHRTAEVAVNARSEVREAIAARRTALVAAQRYRDEIVPMRKRISEEVLLRYNGMLIDVFEVLADARESIGAVTASIEAQRDYWLAEADLTTAATVGSPGGASGASRGMVRLPAAGGAAAH